VKTHLLGRDNAELLKTLNDRLFVVYTGKTRLAKDLLQRVLRCVDACCGRGTKTAFIVRITENGRYEMSQSWRPSMYVALKVSD
jgi:hypothetical protein